jgi:limonene-1,2-epoxide hydrolase
VAVAGSSPWRNDAVEGSCAGAAREGVVLTERVDVLTGPLLFLDLPVCGTFEVRDGQITLWRDYFDLAGAGAKLLVSPIRALLRRR